jgi:DNA recombination protein RmuC
MVVILLVLLVVLLLAAAAAAGTVLGVRVHSRQRAATDAEQQAVADAERQAVVSAAVAAALAQRETTVQRAVDTVIQVAGTELESRLKSGAERVDLRAESFERRAQDISAELTQVKTLVSGLQRDRAQQHGEVVARLEATATAAASLQQTAQGLREVLASPKSRGQWGERMAEDVLRAAGFVAGVNYRQQSTTDAGKRPDFTFLLPQGLELNMDVKFPIDNYVRHLDATTDTERDATRQAFVRDVRNRVREITTREYIDRARTVDHVLLFIPNESVYTFMHESDPALLDKALEQRVVLCSPSTLFAVLGVVRQAMRSFVFERTSDEILECLNRFTKQWDKFSDQVDKVGRHLASLSTAYDDLNGTRRRQLEKEIDRIEVLHSSRQDDKPVGDPADWPPVRELRAG